MICSKMYSALTVMFYHRSPGVSCLSLERPLAHDRFTEQCIYEFNVQQNSILLYLIPQNANG